MLLAAHRSVTLGLGCLHLSPLLAIYIEPYLLPYSHTMPLTSLGNLDVICFGWQTGSWRVSFFLFGLVYL